MGELRRRFSQREDSEHEQVLVRAVIAGLALLYLLLVSRLGGEQGQLATVCLPLAVGYVLGSLLLVGHLVWAPRPYPARRYAGMVLDIATLTTALIIGESTAAIFYPFYLWITLGMGFRFGVRYIYVGAVLSLLSFTLVIAVTDFWPAQPALAGGLWAALLLLPAYSASLLRKLTAALERAEEANRAKSRFLATMSHELRTPLNAIIGVTDLLQGHAAEAERRDLVRTARLAGENLLDMINDVLDVARIESGKAMVQSVEFDLYALLGRIRAMLQPRAASRGLYLNLAIDPEVPHRVRGGEQAIHQVLVNLVANGIKFTERGGVTLRVRARGRDGHLAAVEFSVEDTGIGILEEARARIFEQFVQADESTTRRYGGTGLGLTIASQLVRLLDGELAIEDGPDGGSRFAFTLDLAAAEDGPPSLDGRLIVLGPPSAAAFWCERATALGMTALGVGDLAEARRAIANERRRLVVLVVDDRGASDRVQIAPAVLRRAAGRILDAILVTSDLPAERQNYLACLQPDVSNSRLARALYGALATQRPGQEGEGEKELDPAAFAAATPRRILLAEDNRTNQMVISRILQRAGHSVVLASNGEEALDALERDAFDVVLMDLNMPELGGIDAVKLYRFASPQRDGPPIAALTADVTAEARDACRAVGIEEVIHKPVSAADLMAAVDRLTAGAQGDEDADNVYPLHRRDGKLPAIDHGHLARLRQLDQGDGFFAEVVREFIADAGQLVHDLVAAAEAGDAAAFRDGAHALRSSAAYVGAQAMFQLCLGWRGIAPGELARRRHVMIAQLRDEFERMRGELDDVLRAASAGPAGDAVSPTQIRRPRA